LLEEETTVIPIQVNGKRRAEIKIPSNIPSQEIEKLVLNESSISRTLSGETPKKIIYVPGRIINVVI
jgi:leucyl-tRNA synthetase